MLQRHFLLQHLEAGDNLKLPSSHRHCYQYLNGAKYFCYVLFSNNYFIITIILYILTCISNQGYISMCDSDIDECSLTPQICSQLCSNSPGTFTCSCVVGYILDEDEIHCTSLQDHKTDRAFLVYTQGSNILKLDIGHGTASTPDVVYHGRSPIYAIGTAEYCKRIGNGRV